ncbi:MAG TPA: hypothetical protein VL485_30950 [Ktedonobacteraceae bacterium]|jgi:flagellar basal body-associated protein FliL|nr:hypothetical protein [Ktedonobacteraceae bacterium]
MNAHTEHDATYDVAFAVATRKRSSRTLIIVLSILLAITMIALVVILWIHFSPQLFPATPLPAQQPVHRQHW